MSWEYEVSVDDGGQQRDYINIRTATDVALGEELCVPRHLGSSRSGLRDMLGAAIKALEASPEVTILAGHDDGSGQGSTGDIREGVLTSSSLNSIEMRCSPLHGNGVYAKTSFKQGDVVEISPMLLIQRWEIGRCFIDHRFPAAQVAPPHGTSKVALGLGSVFNHNDTPNLGYRDAKTVGCNAAQTYSQCYYATRDIAQGEELFISYGAAWWKSREHKEIKLGEWRLKHGETLQGRPFYDHPNVAQWCEKVNLAKKQAGTGSSGEELLLNPEVLEVLHNAFMEAEDGNTAPLEAWKMTCDLLQETAQLRGGLDTPLRDTGERAIHRQVMFGHVQNIKWLVRNGADVNASTAPSLDMSPDGTASSSLCPMHVAAIYGRMEALVLLQGAGADINCKRLDGVTPLDFAEDTEQAEAAAWLLLRGGIRGVA